MLLFIHGAYSSGHCSGFTPDSLFMQRMKIHCITKSLQKYNFFFKIKVFPLFFIVIKNKARQMTAVFEPASYRFPTGEFCVIRKQLTTPAHTAKHKARSKQACE